MKAAVLVRIINLIDPFYVMSQLNQVICIMVISTAMASIQPIAMPRLKRDAEPHRRRYYGHHHYSKPSCGPFQRRACYPALRTKAVLAATALGAGLILLGLSQQNGKK